MALTKIEYGALASSQVMNNNFDYLDDRITSLSQSMSSANSAIYSNIASINALITQTNNILRPIGQPIIRLDDTLFEDEIRLEGDAVSRVTYSALFEIYGVILSICPISETEFSGEVMNSGIWMRSFRTSRELSMHFVHIKTQTIGPACLNLHRLQPGKKRVLTRLCMIQT